jgi:hypothetical protein
MFYFSHIRILFHVYGGVSLDLSPSSRYTLPEYMMKSRSVCSSVIMSSRRIHLLYLHYLNLRTPVGTHPSNYYR